LNYLPTRTAEWMDFMKDQHKAYLNFKQELIIEPEIKHKKEESYQTIKQVADHPLSQNKKSIWNQYHEDREIWEEIEKDIKRTRNEIGYFTRPVEERTFSPEEEE